VAENVPESRLEDFSSLGVEKSICQRADVTAYSTFEESALHERSWNDRSNLA
jgi:hypothetical protein